MGLFIDHSRKMPREIGLTDGGRYARPAASKSRPTVVMRALRCQHSDVASEFVNEAVLRQKHTCLPQRILLFQHTGIHMREHDPAGIQQWKPRLQVQPTHVAREPSLEVVTFNDKEIR